MKEEFCDHKPSKVKELDGIGIVKERKKILDNVTWVEIESTLLAERALPGQFALLWPSFGYDPLLGRPFGIAGVRGERVSFLFQTVGRGTEMLESVLPGDPVAFRGPLGQPLPSPIGQKVFLASGGIGVAPLLFAWESLDVEKELHVGVPSFAWKPLTEWIAKRTPALEVGGRMFFYADDGCFNGPTNPVEGLKDRQLLEGEIWGCGPQGMMEALFALSEKCQRLLVSLETRMACGVGGCLGCRISTRNGSKKVCVDGPFFDAKEVF